MMPEPNGMGVCVCVCGVNNGMKLLQLLRSMKPKKIFYVSRT